MLKFPKLKRTRKRKTKVEASLQDACERYLECMGIQYIRIPDAIISYLMQGPLYIRELVSSYMAGQPDLVITDGKRCLLVELKTDVGRVLKSQRNWSKGLELHIVRDITTFRELVGNWVNAQGAH